MSLQEKDGMLILMRNEKVLDVRIRKKVSFDGRLHLVRLPAQITHFLKDNGVSVEDLIVDGIEKITERTFRVSLIFGDIDDEPPEKTEQKKDDDSDEYVYLEG